MRFYKILYYYYILLLLFKTFGIINIFFGIWNYPKFVSNNLF